jgi:hypothetical protein
VKIHVGRWLQALLACAVAALFLVGVARVDISRSFSDPVGDAGKALDITRVDVSESHWLDHRNLHFMVTVSDPIYYQRRRRRADPRRTRPRPEPPTPEARSTERRSSSLPTRLAMPASSAPAAGASAARRARRASARAAALTRWATPLMERLSGSRRTRASTWLWRLSVRTPTPHRTSAPTTTSRCWARNLPRSAQIPCPAHARVARERRPRQARKDQLLGARGSWNDRRHDQHLPPRPCVEDDSQAAW